METRRVAELKANPLNPRGPVVEDDALRELAASIREQGLLQPILITPDGLIIAGHRRAAACTLADLIEVPVMVREMDETTQLQVMLIENLQREDLTALQAAKAYQALIDHGLSIKDISKATGFRSESISKHIDILRLDPELHNAFDGECCLPLGCVRYLVDLDSDSQLRIGNQAREFGWTIDRIKREAAGNQPTAIRDSATAPTAVSRFDRSLLDRIYERVDNGCFTPEAISKCDECGCQVFPALSLDEIKGYLDELVRQKRCRWTPQGGRKDNQRGPQTMLCMVVENEIGSFVGAVNAFQRQPKPRA